MKSEILAYAHSLGFGRVGIASADPLSEAESALGAWLQQGNAGDMAYMHKNWERRARPSDLLPGAKSVIALAASYYHETPKPTLQGGRVARYAWGKDYHKVLEKRLTSLVRYMEALSPGVQCKTYVDSGPLLERAAAQRAGLGFVGKNTMLITRGLGSWVFLASIVTTLELPADAADTRTCGSCTLCIDACPTQAITEPYRLDARRCISYLTIESKADSVPEDLRAKVGDWIFGCDICQDVCPHNTRIPVTPIQEFNASSGVGPLVDLEEVLTLKNEEAFENRFRGTPLKRAKLSGLQRNARVVGDNQKLKIKN